MSNSKVSLDHDYFFVSQTILSVMLATPAVASNVFLLITIFRNTNANQRIWQTPATLLVVNLTICDLMTGLVPGYGSLYYDISVLRGKRRDNLVGMQRFLTVSAVVTNIVSSGTITVMSFDRLLAVSSPFQYKALVTKTKIKGAIAFIWIYSLIFSSLPLMGVAPSTFVLLFCHLHVSFPLIIFPVVYWRTFRALRLHNNQVQDVAENEGRQQIDMAHRNRERKMVSAFLLILISFYVSFAPLFIAQNMLIFHPKYNYQDTFRFFLYTTNKVLIINCCLNPFIYAWRIPTYRRAFKAVFTGCVCLPRNTVSLVMQKHVDNRTNHTRSPDS
ncbi:cannabinoid receptor 1-like [Stylophora pistillata]|uniref:cannabinoid receptor 1-like n=1 Tax=Stylophora pistillata TaxID=50429 RepID=UPI000C03E04D|nr:cannabinoid receptor 1-like [Stylophora pistillata]